MEREKRFVIDCVRSLLRYGCTTHRAEFLGHQCGLTLGLVAHISAFPGTFLVTFRAADTPVDGGAFDDDPQTRGDLRTSKSGSLDDAAPASADRSLESGQYSAGGTSAQAAHCVGFEASFDAYRLAQVDDILGAFIGHTISLDEAVVRLRKVRGRRADHYPSWVLVLASSVASGSASPLLFGGSLADAAFSLVCGALVGVYLFVFARRSKRLARVSEFACATLVGFLSRAGGAVFTPEASPSFVLCPVACTLASTVILLPGLSLTTAITEIAANSIVSGTSRFFRGILVAFQIGFGLSIGDAMGAFAPLSIHRLDSQGTAAAAAAAAGSGAQGSAEASLVGSSPSGAELACHSSMPPGLAVVWLALITVSLSVILNAHWRQWWFIGVVTATGWATFAGLTTGVLSANAATVVAAFAVGAMGAVLTRVTGTQSLVTVMVGIMLLVPGGISVRGAEAMFSGDHVSGVSFGTAMLYTSFSITIGLVLAKSIVPVNRKGRSSILQDDEFSLL